MASGFWDDERTERLKKLVAEGHSFSAIHVILGAPSRSAVIGKAFRLKLASPSSGRHGRTLAATNGTRRAATRPGAKTVFNRFDKEIKDGKTQARRIIEHLSSGKTVEEAAASVGVDKHRVQTVKCHSLVGAEQHDSDLDVARKSLLDLDKYDCRFPVGDPQKPDFGFCARKVIAGLPYCEGHAKRAFQPPQIKPRPSFANDNARAPVRETEKV